MGLADDVARNDLVLIVGKGLGDGRGVGLHRGIDLVDADLLVDDGIEVGEGSGGRGNTLGGADQLAVELGEHKTDGLRSTGGVGDDVLGGRTGATEVTLALRAVEDHLVTGEGVDGGHDARDDGGKVVEALSHRGQAVGGAGGRADDVVIGG